ncbi:hypothetical protein HPP92_014716 [Vanilla planifolia]|uniref:ATP-dependent helicase ATRX n=1 Tax=Vanilla planifolia TaxID=51239 RepID=A0A835UWH7_VANPL|nr:hypothetical protein HPP92_014716 [Vanilla planifolia]
MEDEENTMKVIVLDEDTNESEELSAFNFEKPEKVSRQCLDGDQLQDRRLTFGDANTNILENIADDICTKVLENVTHVGDTEDCQEDDEDERFEGSNASGSYSDEMLGDDSSAEEISSLGNDDERISEAPLSDAEIEELVAEFLETESKAAEAQESLETEFLAQVEKEVREELSHNLHGDALDIAVCSEMQTFVEEWESVLDDLERKSTLLLEQLDGAGIELPSLYRWIESQAPNGCCTDAWKKRIHWIGSVVSTEVNASVREAESFLESCHPVRRKHGRLLEDGASGYLAKKLSIGGHWDDVAENREKDWSSFNELIESHRSSEDTSFGSKNWVSVYLANTPQQAATLGLNFPGVNEVEEIGEIELDSRDPFYSDAVANEKEIDLTAEQKKNFRKVREEDDIKLSKKLQQHLKQKRRKSKKGMALINRDSSVDVFSNECCHASPGLPSLLETGFDDGDISARTHDSYMHSVTKNASPSFDVNGNCKHSLSFEENETMSKRYKSIHLDSDEEVQPVVNGATLSASNASSEHYSPKQAEVIDIIDVDIIPSSDPSRQKPCGKRLLCTACNDTIKRSQVNRHPLLQVAVCRSCKFVIGGKLNDKSIVFSDFCAWCAKCGELVNCTSCNMAFCSTCISRNFGEERLSEANATDWRCYSCTPVLLVQLIAECDKALGSLPASCSESDSELSDADIAVSISTSKRRKKKIRRILDDTELGEGTKTKIAIEKARQEHLKSMHAQSAKKSYGKIIAETNRNTSEITTVRMLEDPAQGYVVNVAREDDEEPVRIAPSMSVKLKLHQVDGIRFMWENIIQSVRKVKSGDKGLGCILAHTMGLGKTLQVIAFLYTAMRSSDLGLRTALIVTPVNVLHNWRQEFLKWKPTELKPLRVLMLEDVVRERRAHLISKWRTKGGVLLMGYAAFRNLSLGRHVKDKEIASEICHALQFGPDVLVCDEAHMIKKTRADITLALKQVQTQRRIALTGSPLQNNLMEYYCMVDFVREGFLGSSHEFRNRFQNPIENGQHTNSTAEDVKIMNQRSHILYEQLKGFVQRMDMNVVKKDLPHKTVFVITVKLSPLQRKLYRRFLDVHGFTGDKVSSDRVMRRSCFFAGYQTLAQIWNHPGLLQMAKEHKSNLKREDAIENFIVDDTSSDDNLEQNDFSNGEN